MLFEAFWRKYWERLRLPLHHTHTATGSPARNKNDFNSSYWFVLPLHEIKSVSEKKNPYRWVAKKTDRPSVWFQLYVFSSISSSTNLSGALPCCYQETEDKAVGNEACSIWKESLRWCECFMPRGHHAKTRTDFTQVSHCEPSLVSVGFSASASAVGSLCPTLLTFLPWAKKCIRKSLIWNVSAGPSAALTGIKQTNSSVNKFTNPQGKWNFWGCAITPAGLLVGLIVIIGASVVIFTAETGR